MRRFAAKRTMALAGAALLAALAIATPLALAESYTYDAAGRLTGVAYDNGKEISYSYDAAGNLLDRTVRNSSTVGDGIAANSLTDAWVDTTHTGTESGTQPEPFDTVNEGIVALVDTGAGTLHIVAGSTAESPTFSKAMTVVAEGGLVTIGAVN